MQDENFHKVRGRMPKVILVNPSLSTVGYSFITPRWLYVLAQATPVDLVGDPVLVAGQPAKLLQIRDGAGRIERHAADHKA